MRTAGGIIVLVVACEIAGVLLGSAKAQDRIRLDIQVWSNRDTSSQLNIVPCSGLLLEVAGEVRITDKEGRVIGLMLPRRPVVAVWARMPVTGMERLVTLYGQINQEVSLALDATRAYAVTEGFGVEIERFLSGLVGNDRRLSRESREALRRSSLREEILSLTEVHVRDEQSIVTDKQNARARLLKMLDELTAEPPEWRLGVTVVYGVQGAVVKSVTLGSAADRAGLRIWDRITEVGGVRVGRGGNNMYTLHELFERSKDGNVELTIVRAGRLMRLPVQLEQQ